MGGKKRMGGWGGKTIREKRRKKKVVVVNFKPLQRADDSDILNLRFF